jgi:signal transduction histidine kinase
MMKPCATTAGANLSEDVLRKAFEPFFTTKPVGSGTGLGLSQVYGIAKQTGGTVTISTKIGLGTNITVYLPRTAGGQIERRIERVFTSII